MPVNATSLANMSAPFFRLPLEIRQDVYGHVFPSKIFHLSEQKVDLFKSRVATLLTTCHTIYMEGTPYFYKEVHIRFLMSWRTPKQTIELTQIRLPLLMHISIDLCCLGLVKRFRKRVLERYKAHTDGVHDDWSDYPELVAEEGADRQVVRCSSEAICRLMCRLFVLRDIPREDLLTRLGSQLTLHHERKLLIREYLRLPVSTLSRPIVPCFDLSQCICSSAVTLRSPMMAGQRTSSTKPWKEVSCTRSEHCRS